MAVIFVVLRWTDISSKLLFFHSASPAGLAGNTVRLQRKWCQALVKTVHFTLQGWIERFSVGGKALASWKHLEGQSNHTQADQISSVTFIVPSTQTNVASTLPPSGIIMFMTKLMQKVIIRMQSFYFPSFPWSLSLMIFSPIAGKILQFITHPSFSANTPLMPAVMGIKKYILKK